MCRMYIKKCLWDRSLWGREGEIRPSKAVSLSGLCGALELAPDAAELAENRAFVTLLSLQRRLGAHAPGVAVTWAMRGSPREACPASGTPNYRKSKTIIP